MNETILKKNIDEKLTIIISAWKDLFQKHFFLLVLTSTGCKKYQMKKNNIPVLLMNQQILQHFTMHKSFTKTQA